MKIDSILREISLVAHLGAEKATAALSSFTGQHISVRIDSVNLLPLEQLADELGGDDCVLIILHCWIKGRMSGQAMLVFDEPAAASLVKIFGCDPTGWGEMERSMMEETANIAISSFMNSLSAHLGMSCIPQPPLFIHDLGGAIIASAAAESAIFGDRLIRYAVRFSCNQKDMAVNLFFMPSPESLECLENEVTHV
jgi:chemotaxis protein CheC